MILSLFISNLALALVELTQIPKVDVKSQEIDLKHGGLSLQVLTEEGGDGKKVLKYQIKKVSEDLKKGNGTTKTQCFYVYEYEAESLTDIMVNIVEINNLKS